MLSNMHPSEAALYEKRLRAARRVVEFGSGGSTVLACRIGAPRIVSVESDPAWIDKLLAVDEVRSALASGALTLLHADIGPVTGFGAPADESCRSRWPDYARAPWIVLPDPDLVLVDGRFRVACTMEALLRCGPDTVVVIHDFWNRPYYHAVLPFLVEQERARTLGVFLPRPGFPRPEAQAVLAEYAETAG